MQENDVIRCMLLPLTADFLLLPNVAVAEVIAYVDPDNIDQKEVLLGRIDWRGVKVPIISFERACQLTESENSSRDRVAIVYQPDGNTEKPYLGIKLTDIPRAFNATTESFMHDKTDVNSDFIKHQTTYNDKRVWIPDVEALFDLI